MSWSRSENMFMGGREARGCYRIYCRTHGENTDNLHNIGLEVERVEVGGEEKRTTLSRVRSSAALPPSLFHPLIEIFWCFLWRAMKSYSSRELFWTFESMNFAHLFLLTLKSYLKTNGVFGSLSFLIASLVSAYRIQGSLRPAGLLGGLTCMVVPSSRMLIWWTGWKVWELNVWRG
jgi:hypothetical protein